MPGCGRPTTRSATTPAERRRAERVTGKPYGGQVEVHHLLDVLVNHLGLEAVREKVKRPLAGLRVACYYGCLLTRPPEIVAFDNPEHPTAMDDLLAAAGGRAGPLAVQDRMLRGQPVDHPRRAWWPAGPQAGGHGPAGRGRLHRGRLPLVPAQPRPAPGRRRREYWAARGTEAAPPPHLPHAVLYVTQLLGLALGLSADELGLAP